MIIKNSLALTTVIIWPEIDSSEKGMVLILEGKSEHVAHAWIKIGLLREKKT